MGEHADFLIRYARKHSIQWIRNVEGFRRIGAAASDAWPKADHVTSKPGYFWSRPSQFSWPFSLSGWVLGPPLLARDRDQKTISAVEANLPYSPDLAPPDYFLFPNMKKHQDERHYLSDEDLITAVEEVFRDQDEGFYTTGIQGLQHRWRTCVDQKGRLCWKISQF